MKTEEIYNNGFSLFDHENHELDMALLSLKIGLVAYFSTYKMVQSFFIFIDEDHPMVHERIRDSGYIHEYFETIFHFHHFIEVSVKEILRDDHELSELKLGSFNMKSAMKHLEKLRENNKIKNYENIDFISFNSIEAFNHLRNRLAHRGIFILDYKCLDKLIGKEILPFIKKLLDLPIYKYHEFRWQPKELYCGIDPTQEIISEYQTQDINFQKIALCKQLALAAYANPIEMPMSALAFKGPTIKEMAEQRAKKERENPVDLPVADIKTCPVCSAESLVRYVDTHDFGPNDQEPIYFIKLIYCECCDLRLDNNLRNVSIKGLDTEELWQLS